MEEEDRIREAGEEKCCGRGSRRIWMGEREEERSFRDAMRERVRRSGLDGIGCGEIKLLNGCRRERSFLDGDNRGHCKRRKMLGKKKMMKIKFKSELRC